MIFFIISPSNFDSDVTRISCFLGTKLHNQQNPCAVFLFFGGCCVQSCAPPHVQRQSCASKRAARLLHQVRKNFTDSRLPVSATQELNGCTGNSVSLIFAGMQRINCKIYFFKAQSKQLLLSFGLYALFWSHGGECEDPIALIFKTIDQYS